MPKFINMILLASVLATGAHANDAEKFFKTLFVDIPKDSANTIKEKFENIPEWVKSKFHCSGCNG